MSRAPDPTFNTTLPEDKGKYGTLQRLMFVIPNPATTLLLGERYKDDPPFGYTGASLKTDVNLFIDIKAKTLYQGHDAVVWQTPATWTQYVTGLTTVYGKANVDVTSGTALLLCAVPPGGEVTGADLKVHHGAEIPAVKSYVPIRENLVKEQQRRLKTWPTVASKVLAEEAKLGTPFTAANMGDWTGHADAVLGSVLAAEGSGPEHAGIGLVSKDPIGMYSSGKVVASGVAGVTLLAGDNETPEDLHAYASRNVDLRAGERAEMFAVKSAAVEGGAQADLSSFGPTLVSSRNVAATVLGKDVNIGALAPASYLGAFEGIKPASQVPTDNVTVQTKVLTKVESEQNIEVEAKTQVTITVGNFTIVVKTDQIKIGQKSGPISATIKADKVTITTGPDTVELKPGSGVTVKSAGSQVVTAPSGVTVAGPMIKIG